MRKYLTSLLILASSLLLPDEIFADEQVRRVQEELRKRHLFYANANGEPSRALTAAVKRYQEKKGFVPTGVIDPETLASLGIARFGPWVASTPFAIGKRGEARGANGEALPAESPFPWLEDEGRSQFDPAMMAAVRIDLETANHDRSGSLRDRATKRHRGLLSEVKTGQAFQIALELEDKRISPNRDTPSGQRLRLHLINDLNSELGAIDGEGAEEMRARSKRPSSRPTRRVRSRKETNPFVLTYRSVDRAIRNLFGDTQTKKKRSTSKRL